jgi:tetratricopeptide (TPR) repeat protein
MSLANLVSRMAAVAVGLVLLLGPAGPVAAQSPTSNGPAVSTATLAEIDSLRQNGDFRKAFARLTTLSNEHPSSAGVFYRLALTRVDMGEQLTAESQQRSYYEAALENAEAALAADSSDAHAHLARAIAEGRVALSAGTKERIRRSRAVKRHADRAIELDSTLAAAYHVRARWNREVADLGFFERTIVRTVYGGLPAASFEQSVRDFETAIRLEDKIVHHLELARTYMKMDRDEEARDHLQTALSMNASDPDDPMHKSDARDLLDDLS